MNYLKTGILLAGVLLQTSLPRAASPAIFIPPLDNPRDRLFDEGWRFHLGDAERAEAVEFADDDWRRVSLPHDWSIEPLSADAAGVGLPAMAAEWRYTTGDNNA